MTAVIPFTVEERAQAGRGASRALRLSGKVPGVLYGDGKENVMLAVDPRDIMKGLNKPGFYTTIFEMKLSGKTERALVKDVHLHPVTDQPLHIDFWRVNKNSKIHIHVPVHFKNEDKCMGIKRGGVLNIVLHSVEVSCGADNIPEEIVIDLAGMDVGDSIHAEAVELPKGVKFLHPERDNTLATIVAPTVQQEDTAGTAGTEAAGTEKSAE